LRLGSGRVTGVRTRDATSVMQARQLGICSLVVHRVALLFLCVFLLLNLLCAGGRGAPGPSDRRPGRAGARPAPRPARARSARAAARETREIASRAAARSAPPLAARTSGASYKACYRSTSRATSTRRTTHPPVAVRSRDETTTLLPEQRVARVESFGERPPPHHAPHTPL
jgi:hypothetical protein